MGLNMSTWFLTCQFPFLLEKHNLRLHFVRHYIKETKDNKEDEAEIVIWRDILQLYDEGRKDYILTRLKNVLPKTFLWEIYSIIESINLTKV